MFALSLYLISLRLSVAANSRLVIGPELLKERLVVNIKPDPTNSVCTLDKQFNLETEDLTGSQVYDSAKAAISAIMLPREVKFECQDLRFMQGRDLIRITHRQAFHTSGILSIIATESSSSEGPINMNLHLPITIPDAEESLSEYMSTVMAIQEASECKERKERMIVFLSETVEGLNLSDLRSKDAFELNFIKDCQVSQIRVICENAGLPLSEYEGGLNSKSFLRYKSLAMHSLNKALKQKIKFRDEMIFEEGKKNVAGSLRIEYLSKKLEKAHSRLQNYRSVAETGSAELMKTQEQYRQLTAKFDKLRDVSAAKDLMHQQLEQDMISIKAECTDLKRIMNERDLALLTSVLEVEQREKAISELKKKHESTVKLLQNLSYSNALGTCFTGSSYKDLSPIELYRNHQFSHTEARFAEIAHPREYSETGLDPALIRAQRTLWLETYYAEGKRLQTWLQVVEDKDWRNQFGFESCYASFTMEHGEQKIRNKLQKMNRDILRLKSRVSEIVREIKDMYRSHGADNESAQLLQDLEQEQDPEVCRRLHELLTQSDNI